MKVFILGTGLGFQQPPSGFEVWCVPGLWGKLTPNRVYELHSGKTLAKVGMPKEKLEWMKEQNMVIHPSLATTFPNGRVFDYEKYLNKFGSYFTSSISWMLAEAIEEGATEIHICGVSMSSASEYSHQKPACTYLIGWARALGIKVVIQEGSELLAAPYIYGYEDKPLVLEAIERRKNQCLLSKDAAEEEWTLAKAKYHTEIGALQMIEFFENNWWAGSKKNNE
jgi:hypothetical protein